MRICCIIKPHALPNTESIIHILVESGMYIHARRFITYTRESIDILYDHMDICAREAIATKMEGKTGLALCIETPSIAYACTVIGEHSNPTACSPESIRARFARNSPEQNVGTWPWWDNVLHRPIDEREALRDMALFFP